MMEEEERGNIQYINFGESDNNDDQDVDYSTLFEPTNQWKCQYCDYSFTMSVWRLFFPTQVGIA